MLRHEEEEEEEEEKEKEESASCTRECEEKGSKISVEESGGSRRSADKRFSFESKA